MSKKPSLRFDYDAAEYVIKRYFDVTTIRFNKEMGQRLVAFRKKFGVSQKELADKLGLNQTDISRLENGKNIAAAPSATAFKTVLDKYFDSVVLGGEILDIEYLSPYYEKQTKHWWVKLKK